ncbi:MAG: ABC transporter ATP-binding protein [Thermosynechococcus sp.]|uniref:ABC transporter ATP-binding protein n=1 Tax=Thermosynechococcus sp. TaxID=2814275 RepID=UPI0021FA4738|nr:ABC transporter ATP-binding protein [Thermosynechococcus sp.]BCX11146.1 MAG: ABC transporter ATP-binding protein [Thermosynechococcus sp.]
MSLAAVIMTNLAIATTNLTKVYRSGHQETPVLQGINLQIQAGHIHLLMGPSGSGKTTLLSILAGILAPTSGQVVVLGQEITQLSKAALAKFRLQNIGFIFQSFNLFPALTALENVEIALNLKGIKGKTAKEQAAALLEAVGLGDRLDFLPANLSGGQKQRVAIARALAGEPKIIFADEPTASLDSQNGQQVIKILDKLAKENNCTVLIVTHDPRITAIADRITKIEDGKISNS